MTEHRPWFASYPKDVPKTLEPYPEVSVFSMLEAAARRFPDNPATAWFGAHMDYRTLLHASERFSTVLAGLGVAKGDRVAFILPNCPQYVVAFYGTVRLGAIAVGNNPLYTQREMEHQLRDSGSKVVVVLDQLYPNYAPVFERLGITDVIVTSVTDAMRFPLKQLAPLKFRREARAEGKPWPPVPADAKVLRWTDALASASVHRRTFASAGTGGQGFPSARASRRNFSGASCFSGKRIASVTLVTMTSVMPSRSKTGA